MAKKRRSREFRNSSQVIDIEVARRKRQEKRKKNRGRSKALQEQQARRAATKKDRQKRALFYTVAILVMLSIAGASIYNIVSLQQEQKVLLTEQEQLKEEKQELEEELKYLKDPDYIEEQARAQLRLVMPGESIYVFPSGSKESERADRDEEAADDGKEEN